MNLLKTFFYFVRPLFGFQKLSKEIDEEIRAHLELATEANIAKGMSPEDARRAAESELGKAATACEHYRDARGVSWFFGWWQDLRQAARSLFRAKWFSIVAITTLALGIGSAAAIFSLVDWVLFRSVNYPEDVVVVGATNKRGEFNGARYEVHVQAYREQAVSLAEYAYARPYDMNVAIDGETVTNGVTFITPNLFSMLRVAPVLGRSFMKDDLGQSSTGAVIISDSFWLRYFNRSPDVLGRKVVIDGRLPYTVVGVLASDQVLPPNLKADVFAPLFVPNAFKTVGFWYIVFARVKPDVTLAQVDADLDRIKVDLPAHVAAYSLYTKPHVVTLAELSSVKNRQIYWVLVGAVGFLYAIACLNATNLMVVRILNRRRELGIRLALGGERWRIVRLLGFESALITSIAGAGGVLVANWLAPLLRMALNPEASFHWARWSLDPRALLILIGVTALTAIAILVVPAVRILKAGVLDGLKDGGPIVGEGPTLVRLRLTMVVLQAAFAVVLLTGAGLMVRTLIKLQDVNFGFDESHLIKLQLAFPPGFAYPTEAGVQRLERLQKRLEQVPGVTSAAYGSDTLVAGKYGDVVKVQTDNGPIVSTELNFISENFLQTSGIRLLYGSMGDRWGKGVLINRTLARQMFGDKDPIGQIMHPVEGGQREFQWHVYGVVSDVRETARSVPRNHIYASSRWSLPLATTFIIRSDRLPDGKLTELLKQAVYQNDPRLIVSYVVPLSEAIGWQHNVVKFVLATLKFLSGIALALTAIGLFAVLAFTVNQRMSEFAVRQALGARPRDLIVLVVRASMLIVSIGVGLGLLGAVSLSQYLRSLLFEVPTYDPKVLGTVATVVMLSGLVASLVPAARAARADIVKLLRAE